MREAAGDRARALATFLIIIVIYSITNEMSVNVSGPVTVFTSAI